MAMQSDHNSLILSHDPPAAGRFMAVNTLVLVMGVPTAFSLSMVSMMVCWVMAFDLATGGTVTGAAIWAGAA